jgi:hypothetical protein
LDENGGRTKAGAGKYQYPKKRGLKYRLNVRVDDRNGWPKPVSQRVSPIYVPLGDDPDYLGDQYDQAVEGQVPDVSHPRAGGVRREDRREDGESSESPAVLPIYSTDASRDPPPDAQRPQERRWWRRV